MDNLIMNARWQIEAEGMPQCFTNQGPITYDNFCVNGNRTCSVTMIRKGGQASTTYDVPIPICGQQSIAFGCCIRCVGCDCCYLQCDFYDANNCLINSDRENITSCITADFNTQMARFRIPCNCTSCQVSIQFMDRVTACSYCAPFAYFC